LQQTTMDLGELAEGAQAAGAAGAASTFESKSYLVPVDGFFGMAMGAEQGARQLIDAVRGKAPRLQAAGGLAQAMAATRARQDSVMRYMSRGGLRGGAAPGAPEGVLVTMGFDQARMRVLVAAGR